MPVTINYPSTKDTQPVQVGGPTGDRVTADWANKVQKSWEAGQDYVGYTGDLATASTITGRLLKREQLTNAYRGTSVASATTIASIPTVGDIIPITGTTNITDIATSGGPRRVTLEFQDALTVFNGNSLHLAADYNVVAGDTLTLHSDGATWYEDARSSQVDLVSGISTSFISLAKWGF